MVTSVREFRMVFTKRLREGIRRGRIRCVARHGAGENVYLIRFHYLPPGAWDVPRRQPERGLERE
jgi:hypothetical protein